MSGDYDYSAFKDDDAPAEDLLVQIATIAEAVQAAENEVAEKEGEVAAAKQRLQYLAWTVLPELMEKAKMESFTTSGGLTVVVKEDLRVTLPKETQDGGLHWLRQNGHDAIIKTKVTAEFAMGHEAEALKLNEQVRKMNHANSKVDTSVAWTSLTSLFKELINKDKGTDIPTHLFKVFRQRVASVK